LLASLPGPANGNFLLPLTTSCNILSWNQNAMPLIVSFLTVDFVSAWVRGLGRFSGSPSGCPYFAIISRAAVAKDRDDSMFEPEAIGIPANQLNETDDNHNPRT
jgi:hypothetical protein